MHEHHRALAQAFGVRRTDEVLAKHVDRLGAQDARVGRDTREREHDGG